MTEFTPYSSLIGGVLIGLASSMMLVANGRIAGISGILGRLLPPTRGDVAWRLLFVGGLVLGGLAVFLFSPARVSFEVDRSFVAIVAAGLLVGFGSRLGSGCTSGHGVCGLSRLSMRSLVATGTFMLTGALTVLVVNHFFGGSL